MRVSPLSIPCLALAACAAQTAALPAAEPVWSAAVDATPHGNAGLVLDIRNEVTTLGTLQGVAAVLDGAVVFRETPWRTQQPLTFWTTGGRHQLCVVAHYEGSPEAGGTYVVRAPRLLDLVPGSAVSARLLLQQQLTPQPYATAQYLGGVPYAGTSTPDPAKYESRLDELCGNRP
jgi:hypothetical protein